MRRHAPKALTPATIGLWLAVAVSGPPVRAQFQGWDIPLSVRGERSPLAGAADAPERGRVVFAAHCARCHGPEGKGNGPGSDHAADLTDDLRTSLNTDAVLFYKVWNGHAVQLRTQIDDMPAFRDTLSREQVWTVVEYLKRLRVPAR